MSNAQPKIIHAFPKNPNEEIRATVQTYRKRDFIDLRVYYRADDGDFKPTKKGICIDADLIGDLVEAVSKLQEAVEA